MKRAGIIGFGNIGKKLYEKLLENGWQVSFIVTRDHVFSVPGVSIDRSDNWVKYCHDVDVVFLAISTLDDGEAALHYIKAITERGISVVTCEKGALSNYFGELSPVLHRIGYSATVGGGSGLIHFLKGRFFSGICEVHAIVNSTMNYIWDDLAMGNPLGHVVEEAKKLGYAEPGEDDPIEIIFGEACFDVPKKVSNLFNLCFDSNIILRAKLISILLTSESIRQAIAEAANRRFVVSFVREENFSEESSDILAFITNVDEWIITGGFKKMDSNPLIARLCKATTWVNNAVLTVEGKEGSGGVYLCIGPGAGSSPVSIAMMRDAEVLLQHQR